MRGQDNSPPEVERLAELQHFLCERLSQILSRRSELDEWTLWYTHCRPIRAQDENIPLLEVKKAVNMECNSDVRVFMSTDDDSQPPFWEDGVTNIEDFCSAAPAVLDAFIDPASLGKILQLQLRQKPNIWIYDYTDDERRSSPSTLNYLGKALSTARMLQVLRTQRLREGGDENVMNVHRRLITSSYIADPDGSSTLALIRTAPQSQERALQNLFLSYINSTPEPRIVVEMPKAIATWGFELAFHVPYFVIRDQHHDCEDIRTISKGTIPLRRRYDLSFLKQLNGDAECAEEGGTQPKHHHYLYEAQISCVITGLRDWYWTAYCFNDEFFDEESRLESDEQAEGQDGRVDPILNVEGTRTCKEPRAYWLQALANNLDHAVNQHARTKGMFHASIAKYVSDFHSILYPSFPSGPFY
ncbi:hypothetical protein FOMA001_g17994 [Fusarium oxysporum f. sp. matthiolae]|nr:hypothetical protein FOMA001_g17994 [Fusarium oxysporum f. sp. matthiolae]